MPPFYFYPPIVCFLPPYRVLFTPLLVHLGAWLRHSRSPKYLKYLEVFKSIYSAREACVCVLIINNRKRPWGEPLPKPHTKPWSLRSVKRCGFATLNSGSACVVQEILGQGLRDPFAKAHSRPSVLLRSPYLRSKRF